MSEFDNAVFKHNYVISVDCLNPSLLASQVGIQVALLSTMHHPPIVHIIYQATLEPRSHRHSSISISVSQQ